MSINDKSYPHYFKRVPVEKKEDGTVGSVTHIDIYNVLEMWEVFLPAVAHAAKKLLCAGGRGYKDYAQDLQEVIACLQRELELVQQRELTPFLPQGIPLTPTPLSVPVSDLTQEEVDAIIDRKLKAMDLK